MITWTRRRLLRAPLALTLDHAVAQSSFAVLQMKIWNNESKSWKTGAKLGLVAVATVGMLHTSNSQAADPKWDTSAGLGLTLTEGNSETLLAAANIQTKGSYKNYAISLGADATYGEQSSVKNSESYRFYGQYDRRITERFYVYGRGEYFKDAIADIDYRVKLSPGFGWHLIKKDRLTLDVEVGPGYVFQKLGNVSDSFLTLRAGEKLTYKISDNARLWQSAEFVPEVSDFGNYFVSFELGVEADLTTKMALRTVIQDEYTAKPATGRKSNDVKLITSLNYKF